jgi:hypothetical protein
MHYAKAPYFRELEEPVAALVKNPEPRLGEYNMHAIATLARLLRLETTMVRSSTYAVAEASTLRLVELVTRVGARTYLAGGGATAYQQDELFEQRGLGVVYQGFVPPSYPRGAQPVMPGLSVIDALFWLGVEGTRALLETPPSFAAAAMPTSAGSP